MKIGFLVYVFFLGFLCLNCSRKESQNQTDKLVKVEKVNGKYTLLKAGKPVYINGAAGYKNMELLVKYGGNTIRTWSCENADSILNEASKHNIHVILGLFLQNELHGFDYEDKEAVKKQFDEVKEQVKKYKDHPALLMWGVGNEMDITSNERNIKTTPMWNAVNEICAMIHEIDPHHPTTTMVIPFRKSIWEVNNHCPELDILSINTFGALHELSTKLNEPFWGWDGAYLISEWGGLGWWEVKKTMWDAPVEATSTKKAEYYFNNYSNIAADTTKCIGSCVFYWGQKQEKTPSWFSMFTQDGRPTEAVSIMRKFWTKNIDTNQFPKIEYMLLDSKGAESDIFLKANSHSVGKVLFNEPDNEVVDIHWEIIPDMVQNLDPGQNEISPEPIKGLITQNNKEEITFSVPAIEGPYRLYVYISDPQNQVAVCNTPFFVID